MVDEVEAVQIDARAATARNRRNRYSKERQ